MDRVSQGLSLRDVPDLAMGWVWEMARMTHLKDDHCPDFGVLSDLDPLTTRVDCSKLVFCSQRKGSWRVVPINAFIFQKEKKR